MQQIPMFGFLLFLRLIQHERRSTPFPIAAGTTARPPHGGAIGLGAELPAA